MVVVCICGKQFATEVGIRTHIARLRCRGPPRQDDTSCQICNRQFGTYAGKRQHQRLAHPDEYNRELEDRYEPADNNAAEPTVSEWTDLDFINMAKIEARYEGRFINKHLQTHYYPERSIDFLKNRRKRQDYKDLVESFRREGGIEPVVIDDERPPIEPEISINPEQIQLPNEIMDINNITPDDLETPNPIKAYILEMLNNTELNLSIEETKVASLVRIRDVESKLEMIRGCLEAYHEHLVQKYCPQNVAAKRNNTAQKRGKADLPGRNHAARRANVFKNTQTHYARDTAKTAAAIIDGKPLDGTDDAPDMGSVEAVYAELFQSEGPVDDQPFEVVRHEVDVGKPVTEAEVVRAIKAAKSNAAGPDGIKTSAMSKIPARSLALLYNLCLNFAYFPVSWKVNRTILLPKSGDLALVGNWRPITISSAFLRVINRILAARFQHLPINPLQRGFRQIDGILANTASLQGIIKDRREKREPYSILSLDLAKAFDSVSHKSIERALKRFHTPPWIANFIVEGYRESRTNIFLKDKASKDIIFRRGVKQGDPLSPIIFNLVLDELIESMCQSGEGIEVGDGRKVPTIAYADDLLLISDTAKSAQRMLKAAISFFEARGMALNIAKCAATTVNVNRSSKSMYTVARNIFHVGGVAIQQLAPSQQFKYLGKKYNTMGTSKDFIQDLDVHLGRVAKSALKSHQKLNVIRTYLLPRYLDMLQNPEITLRVLKGTDRLVRIWVRRILHLHKTSPDAFIHTPVREGGLGLTSFRTAIPTIYYNRLAKLYASGDLTMRALLGLPYVERLRNKIEKWCNERLSSSRNTQYWSDRLETGWSGNGLRQGNCHAASGSWITSPPKFWSGSDFNQAVQLRGNLLPTRGIPSNPPDERNCRAGCQRVESLCHVLQKCPLTHHARIRRHDHLVNRLKGFAQEKGWTVVVEPRIRCMSGRLRIPDLILTKDDQAIVSDVAVSWEGPNPLMASYNNKLAKYGEQEFIEAVRNRLGHGNITVAPMIIGARGTWCNMNRTLVARVGLSKSAVANLVSGTIIGSIAIHRSFNKQSGSL